VIGSNQVIQSVQLLRAYNNKSSHPYKLGENTPMLTNLHSLENANNVRKHLVKCIQPDGTTPAKISAMSCSKNIKLLALEDLYNLLLHTFESESCNYESASTDTVDSNIRSVDPYLDCTRQTVKSQKFHHREIILS
jgi:hypothetical protein